MKNEAKLLQDNFLDKVHLQWFADPSGDSGGEGGQTPGGKPDGGTTESGKPDASGGQDGLNRDGTGSAPLAETKLPPWSEQVEKSLRNDPELQEVIAGIKDVNDLFRKYRELKGAQKPESGEPNSSASQNPEEYKLTVPEGMERSEEIEAAILKMAKAANLSNEQANMFYQAQMEGVRELQEAEAAANKEAKEQVMSKLKEEFGEGGFEKALGTASAMIKKIGGDEFSEWVEYASLDGVKAGNHPAFVMGMVKLAQRIEKKVGSDVFESETLQGATPPRNKKGVLIFPNTPGMDK